MDRLSEIEHLIAIGDLSAAQVFTQMKQLIKPSFKARKTEDWHEDLGGVLFISFGRDKTGQIQGEPPEFYMGSGYLEDDFDDKKWTHFIEGNFNFIFTAADPVNFPALD